MDKEKLATIKDDAEIMTKVNKLCRIKQQIDELKKEAEEIEGYFLTLAEDALADTKLKTVKYPGADGNLVNASFSTSTIMAGDKLG